MQFQENVWTNVRKDEQALFHRTLPATIGGPKRTKRRTSLTTTVENKNVTLLCLIVKA